MPKIGCPISDLGFQRDNGSIGWDTIPLGRLVSVGGLWIAVGLLSTVAILEANRYDLALTLDYDLRGA